MWFCFWFVLIVRRISTASYRFHQYPIIYSGKLADNIEPMEFNSARKNQAGSGNK
jgi:hypothetical protein